MTIRTPLFLAALLAVVLSLASREPGAAADATGPREVRVIWTESPQTTAVVAWSTTMGDDAGFVELALDAPSLASGTDTRRVDAQACGVYSGEHDDLSDLRYHHARITGLEPSTTIWFRVTTGGVASRVLHFTTAPADDRPFAILSGGDSRSDRAMRQAMNRRLQAIATARPDVLAFAHGGDYIRNGLDLGQWWAWLEDHQLVTTADGRVLPVVPTRGNHEGTGPLYDEVWARPGGAQAEDWFATKLARDVLLITLNSETATDGDQRDFLAATLQAHAGVPWKLVQYHRPIFPGVKTPGRAKSHWQPLFDEFGVRLALESDGHVLKRTVPIRGDARDDEHGVVYLGEGGLGVAQRTPEAERWYLQPPGMSRSAHHVWIVAFGPDGIAVEAIGVDGERLDTARIPPR
ncbi:MAG: metallophosphoesterase family protein [Planctomycetes bacterium]|nr:metallophosphoesterase family protein [Planctomycetota bacterium]